MDMRDTITREARCGGGQVSMTFKGEPERTYAYACTQCQRTTGTAFAYRAMYRQEALVSATGETMVWRRPEGPGTWIEHVSCARCGTLVYQRGEKISGRLSVSVGCFTDPGFPPPSTLHFASRAHEWLQLPIASVG